MSSCAGRALQPAGSKCSHSRQQLQRRGSVISREICPPSPGICQAYCPCRPPKLSGGPGPWHSGRPCLRRKFPPLDWRCGVTIEIPRAHRAMEHEEFQGRFLRLFSRAPAGLVQDHRFLELAPASADWVDTGLALHPGDRATLLALGHTRASTAFPEIRFQALLRVGLSGPVFSGGSPTHSIVASKPGTLQFALSLLDDRSLPPGRVSGVAIRWRTPALKGLRHLANGGDVGGLVCKEIVRLCDPADRAYRWARPAASRS